MATLSSIIKRAYRESQTLDINASPSAAQEAEALDVLRGIIARHMRPPVLTAWLGIKPERQRGGDYRDFTPYLGSWALPQDIYLNCNLDSATTVQLPPAPGDGARITVIDYGQSFASNPLTIEGNGNTVDGGASIVLGTNGQNFSLFYRRDLADWSIVSPLVAANNSPFPEEFDDMLVIETAMRINPRYGQQIDQITAGQYAEMRSRFKSRYISNKSSVSPDILWDRALNINSDVGGRLA